MLHVGTCDTGSQNSGMLVASRILGNSLVNDLCCLVTCVVWHVFHVGMMEMEECALHSTGIVCPCRPSLAS